MTRAELEEKLEGIILEAIEKGGVDLGDVIETLDIMLDRYGEQAEE